MNKTIHFYRWFWWQHRISLSLMLFTVAAAQLFFWIGSESYDIELTMVPIMISIAVAVVVAIQVFTFGGNLDLTSGRSSFPKWLFTLPIKGVELAMIPVVAMIAALAWGWIPASLAFGHFWATENTFDLLDFSLFVFLPWLGMSAFGCWLQAVS